MIWNALGHMISCKEASRLVSRREDERMPFWQRLRLRLRLHLAICVACAQFESQVRFLRTAMRRYRE